MKRKLFKTMFSVALAVCLMGNTVSASELGITETEEVSEFEIEDSAVETVDVSAGDAAQEHAVEEYTVEEYTEEVPVEGAATGLTYTVEGDTVTITGEGECWTYGSEIKKAIDNAKNVVFRDCKIRGSMKYAFSSCDNLQQGIDMSGLDTADVTSMESLFSSCINLQNLNLSGLNTSNVTNMSNMFSGCMNLKSLDLRDFDTSKVKNMYGMFERCRSLTSLNLDGFDTSQVTDMGNMFHECIALTDLNINGFNTAKVAGTDMDGMFYCCSSLTSLDLSSFDTSNITTVYTLFGGCSKLTYLDLSSFDLSKIPADDFGLQTMLTACPLQEIRTPKILPAGCSILLGHDYRTPVGAITDTLTPEFAGTTLTLYIPVDEQFTDVPTGAWYVSAVQYAYDNGIMTGKTATNFAPNANLTRAEFATVLYSQAGKPAVTYRPIFKDVAQGAWYTSSVLWAYDNGIVSGYANGSFGTSDKITREQLALMMYKYAQTKGYDTTADDSILSSFSDEAAISSWARKAIQWATSHGIMSGKGNGADGKPMLDPKGNATRAECAAMIKKLFTME